MSAAITHHKSYSGAPFGSQAHRFDVSGIHPNSKHTGSYTEVSYDRKALTSLARRFAPNLYAREEYGDFTERNLAALAKGPGWARALEVSRMSKIPHLLYKETWEQEKLARDTRGPGKYNNKDFVQVVLSKGHSKRGLMDLYEPRFFHFKKMDVPPPGCYGKDGIPHKKLEEKANQSFSKLSSFEWSKNVDRGLPTTGSAVAPGTYEYRSFIDELVRRRVSARGPYDTFTPMRGDLVRQGYQAQQRPIKNLGPGEFNKRSFVEELEAEQKVGRFGAIAQYPEVPTERIFYSYVPQHPRKKDEPGPCEYNYHYEYGKPTSLHLPPFGKGAERCSSDLAGSNAVGVGRYDLRKVTHSVPSNESAFKSKTEMRPEEDRKKVLNERLKPHIASDQPRVIEFKAKEYEDLVVTKRMLNQSAAGIGDKSTFKSITKSDSSL